VKRETAAVVDRTKNLQTHRLGNAECADRVSTDLCWWGWIRLMLMNLTADCTRRLRCTWSTTYLDRPPACHCITVRRDRDPERRASRDSSSPAAERRPTLCVRRYARLGRVRCAVRAQVRVGAADKSVTPIIFVIRVHWAASGGTRISHQVWR
jgi:hypothetical protein